MAFIKLVQNYLFQSTYKSYFSHWTVFKSRFLKLLIGQNQPITKTSVYDNGKLLRANMLCREFLSMAVVTSMVRGTMVTLTDGICLLATASLWCIISIIIPHNWWHQKKYNGREDSLNYLWKFCPRFQMDGHFSIVGSVLPLLPQQEKTRGSGSPSLLTPLLRLSLQDWQKRCIELQIRKRGLG